MTFISHSDLNASFRNVVLNSIEDNFEAGGRYGNGALGGGTTQWERSARSDKQKGKTLQDTGLLAASIRVSCKSSGGLTFGIENNLPILKTTGSLEITAGSNRMVGQYSLGAIHQYGGSWQVPVTKRMRGYFWSQYYKSGDVKYKFMALTNKTEFNITMPARPFLVLQDEDMLELYDKYHIWVAKNMQ